MAATDTSEISFWETHPNCRVRVVRNGKRMTMLYAVAQPGAEVPEHEHPHEQMGYCLQGEATFRMGGKTVLVKKGYTYLIPPNTLHSSKITGKEEYIVIEVFSPARPDLLRGEFAPEKLSRVK